MQKLKIHYGSLLPCLIAVQSGFPLHAMAGSSSWTIDSKTSNVHFYTKNGASMSVQGTFSNVSGEVQYDPSMPGGSRVSAKIPLNTISTSIVKRDEDLKSVGYFDVAKYADASFVSTKFAKQAGSVTGAKRASSGKDSGSKSSKNKYVLTGKFTLHGVTKVVDVVMDLPKLTAGKDGQSRLSAIGSTVVDQGDYNLTLKKLHPDGFVWINKAITIVVKIDAVKKR